MTVQAQSSSSAAPGGAGSDPIARLPERALVDARSVTAAFQAGGCRTFRTAAAFVWHLPYGRNADRANYHLVLTECRGTCSTKHALLAALALEQGLAVELRLGLYQMTEANTPGVGRVLEGTGLPSILEAHCWLRYLGADIDLTMPPWLAAGGARSFLHAETIAPDQIGAYKASVHRRCLADWLTRQGRADFGLNDAWRIREACIAALSGDSPAAGADERGS